MDRIEVLRQRIDDILRDNPSEEQRRCGFVHLYGVAQVCVVLAKRRGLNPELAAMAGMLHDIYSYKFQYDEEHAEKGSVLAREILGGLEIAPPEEITLICDAIYYHSKKAEVGTAYQELLKDADVLQHCTYNPNFSVKESERARYESLLRELAVPDGG